MDKKYQYISGSFLKVTAVISMLIDHIAFVLLSQYPPALQPLFDIAGHAPTPYILCRYVGRIAFPIYAFLLTEGFLHTRDRKRYGRNLLIFALLSELPWNLVHSGTLFYKSQNVFFTLFLGYLGLCALERFKDDLKKQSICLIALYIITYLLRSDYGVLGFGFVLVLYLLREKRAVQAIVGCCILSSRWIGGLAFIPINMYNGERGFIRGNIMKYAFYLFYPVHLLVLYGIRLMWIGY